MYNMYHNDKYNNAHKRTPVYYVVVAWWCIVSCYTLLYMCMYSMSVCKCVGIFIFIFLFLIGGRFQIFMIIDLDLNVNL